MTRLSQALRPGIRMLRSARGVAIVAVLTLGITVNVAVSALVYSVLLRPLPHRDADRLVAVSSRDLKLGRDHQMAPLDFFDFERSTSSFERLGAYYPPGFTLTGTGAAERVPGARASSGIFEVFGVQPILGRTFRRDEDKPGAPPVAVISHGLWARQFNSRPDIVGGVITLSGRPYTVIGVLPEAFVTPAMWPRMPDVWVPIGLDPNVNLRDARMLRVLGRLRPGTSIDQARSDLGRIAAALAKAYPETNASTAVSITPLLDSVTVDARPSLLILVAAVNALLLVAAGNAVGLILVGTLRRRFEFATRLALGATHGGILRQIVVEHLILGVVAGASGLLLAYAASNRLAAAATVAGLPRAAEVHVGGPAVAVGVALSVACTVIAALVAGGIVVGRAKWMGIGRHDRAATARRRGTATLLVAQAAFSLALSTGGLLLVRSLFAIRAVDPGFDVEHTWTVRLSPPAARYPAGPALAAFYDRVLAGARSQPDVDTAAVVDWLPASGAGSMIGFTIPDLPSRSRQLAELRIVSQDYFRALSIPPLRGRMFDDRDRHGAPHVTIVNEAFARTMFGTTDVVGRHLAFDKNGVTDAEIVGVTADVREISRRLAPAPGVYLPKTQQPWLTAETRELVLKMKEGQVPSAQAFQQLVREIDTDVPVGPIARLDEVTSTSIVRTSVYASAVAIIAVVAVLLAAFGIHGAVSAVVAERTRQIGICLALGATSLRVIRDTGRHGLVPTVIGLMVGVPLALGAGQLVRAQLFGIQPTDAATLAMVLAVMLAVAVVSAVIPARRASRVDPAKTLRHESA